MNMNIISKIISNEKMQTAAVLDLISGFEGKLGSDMHYTIEGMVAYYVISEKGTDTQKNNVIKLATRFMKDTEMTYRELVVMLTNDTDTVTALVAEMEAALAN